MRSFHIHTLKWSLQTEILGHGNSKDTKGLHHINAWAIRLAAIGPAAWKPTQTELPTPKQKAGSTYFKHCSQTLCQIAGIPVLKGLGRTPRMHGSFMQKILGQVVLGLQPAVASVFSCEKCFILGTSMERRINWRLLMNGVVVSSTFKPASQFLLRYSGLWK